MVQLKRKRDKEGRGRGRKRGGESDISEFKLCLILALSDWVHVSKTGS